MSIELTDEQKLIAQCLEITIGTPLDVTAETDQYDNLKAVYSSLTPDQLIQLLEAKGGYGGVWTEFDAEDESTWPIELDVVMTNLGYGWLFYPSESEEHYQELEWEISTDGFIYKVGANVTHWCELPKFKGE